jgi:NAD(P)-dependent dehydrogenase (short-subunit alcohol dehydrogenase family)
MIDKGMLKQNSLTGKTVIITGGGSGLGKSMGRYFLELGANLVIASRKEDVLNSTAKELTEKTSGIVLPVTCDVRKYSDVENVLFAAKEKFGKVNVLVNNAAGNFISPTERLSHKAFDVITDIVLKGSYYTTLALGKYWIKHQIKGTILNIVTTYAETGSGYVVPSALSKAGVIALTKSLASEWAKYDIRSNAIAPGPFPTEGAWTRLFPDIIADKIDPLKRIPMKRFGEHEELANLAAYLISDFSSFINGDIITIDGGESIYGAGEFNGLDNVPAEMWPQIEKMVRKKK